MSTIQDLEDQVAEAEDRMRTELAEQIFRPTEFVEADFKGPTDWEWRWLRIKQWWFCVRWWIAMNVLRVDPNQMEDFDE